MGALPAQTSSVRLARTSEDISQRFPFENDGRTPRYVLLLKLRSPVTPALKLGSPSNATVMAARMSAGRAFRVRMTTSAPWLYPARRIGAPAQPAEAASAR